MWFPLGSLVASLFVLVLWLLQDWKHLTIIMSLMTLTSLGAWWITISLSAYGIGFGIQKLSGSIYLNLFLFNIVSAPTKLIIVYFENRYGRKRASIGALCVVGIGGLTVGIVQYIDTPYRANLTNYFALAAMTGIHGVCGPVRTMVVELYPTVVRNIGFGFQSTMGRAGAVIGQKLVYLSQAVPGLLYIVVASLATVSIAVTLCLPETVDSTLIDRMSDKLGNQRVKESQKQQRAKRNAAV